MTCVGLECPCWGHCNKKRKWKLLKEIDEELGCALHLSSKQKEVQ